MIDVAIKGGTCVLPWGTKQVDVGLNDGKICAIGEVGQAKQVIDATGLHVLPGILDTQVHMREPGLEYKEDLAHGTKAAILGGITSVFEMPNTKPATITKEALNDKLARAAKSAWGDHAFFVGGTPDPNVDWHALEMLPGCAGIKIFMGSSTGDLLVSEDEAIEAILKKVTRRVSVHSEDENRLKERFNVAQEGADPSFHPKWRDEQTAIRATKRLVAIADRLGKPVHILHITTADEMQILKDYKHVMTVECLPQHLTFCDEDYAQLGSRLQMNPPIRAAQHRQGLWEAVEQGIVDVLGSDHAPHTLEEKAKPYPESPAGLPGVQTILPIMLNHVNEGRLSLERVVDLMAHGPQRVFQIAGKGRLALGYDADVTIVDMNATHTLKDEDMASKCGWTPYDGMTIKGKPTHTIVRGNIVMEHGNVLGEPLGKPVRFIPTLCSAHEDSATMVA